MCSRCSWLNAARVLQIFMAKLHVCNSIYQEQNSPAAIECLNLMWSITVRCIKGWEHQPKVMAAITDSNHRHNAAHSRGAFVLSHFRGLVGVYCWWNGCQLHKLQPLLGPDRLI